jgi:hypothetical protein
LKAARLTIGLGSLVFALGCSGLKWPWTRPQPVPPLVIVIPAPVIPGGAQVFDPLTEEPEEEEDEAPPSRLEIFWGPPEQGDAVWAEGKRMAFDYNLGPHGTWFLDVEPGMYEIVIRDGVNGGQKHAVQNDLFVGDGEVLWCHPLEFDPEAEEGEYLLLADDCRRSSWPGSVRRDPL